MAGRTCGKPLDRPERLQLGEREVLGEPAGQDDAVDDLGRPALANSGRVGDVGGAGDLVLVPGDQNAVLGRDQVGLDVVGAHADRELVRGQGVLGPVAGGAAMRDDQGLAAVGPVSATRFGRGRCQPDDKRSDGSGGKDACVHGRDATPTSPRSHGALTRR